MIVYASVLVSDIVAGENLTTARKTFQNSITSSETFYLGQKSMQIAFSLVDTQGGKINDPTYALLQMQQISQKIINGRVTEEAR